ncbi:MAG: hypothetical protein IKR04_00150 [Clostridia bacterium]|nr:hypothetical protein [Clostridia bacterium]
MEIMQMSAQEIVLMNAFAKLAEEAFMAEKTIKDYYGEKAFGLGEKEIHVFHTESCDEYYGDGYITIDGVFKYQDNWWGGRSYEFSCNAEGIYQMLRSCYLRNNGLSHLESKSFDCQVEHIDSYFRSFIKKSVALKSKPK